MITAACHEENAAQMDETNANNGAYLQRLINDHGVELRAFSDDMYEAFAEAAEEVFEEVRDHSPLAAKVNDAYQGKLRELATWFLLADVGYSNRRNAALGIEV